MTASGLGALPLAPGSLDDALNGIGYAVLDSAALPSFCALVRGEIDGLHTRGLLQASANKLATSRSEGVVAPDAGHVLAKRGVWELDVVLRGDVVAPDALEACPTLAHWYATECTAMLHTLQAAFPAAHLTGLVRCPPHAEPLTPQRVPQPPCTHGRPGARASDALHHRGLPAAALVRRTR